MDVANISHKVDQGILSVMLENWESSIIQHIIPYEGRSDQDLNIKNTYILKKNFNVSNKYKRKFFFTKVGYFVNLKQEKC